MPDLSGKKLGEFEVQELIGAGALGRVYRALQMPFRRPVALKVLEQGLFTPDDMIERFQREAEAMARMEHPHILPIYAAGTVLPYHYISMRLVKDGTLDDRMDREDFPEPATAVTWLRQVVWALSHAHARGVVHRDIKPSNILIADGVALLGDFGIAKLKELSTITDTGTTIGTPLYMSPEQAKGERADVASDLFAVGILLYQLATRVHPFMIPEERDLPVSQRQSLLFERITKGRYQMPRRRNRELPERLEAIVVRCLQPDPAARYATAFDLLRDLNLLQSEVGHAAVPEGRDALAMLPASAEAPAPTGNTRFFRKRTPATPPGGKPFGRYLLYEELGHGATGVVHRGHDPELDRSVAVKILRGGRKARPVDLEMFRHEARTAARLNHPHIVDVYDAGILDGQPFLVMELAPGPSLDRVVKANGPLPVRWTLEAARQALLALRAAHSAGVTHLDVKPGNILLREGAVREAKEGPFRFSTPHVLLSDFTLAKVGVESAPVASAPEEAEGETGTHGRRRGKSTIMGTPAYMSPEQAEGRREDLDGRSDLFSMGAVLYHLLAGRPAFALAGTGATAVMRLFAAPVEPLRKARPDVPEGVETICRRALEKDREKRYAKALEFIDAVEVEIEKMRE
jgi:serine/threonine protein kinase